MKKLLVLLVASTLLVSGCGQSVDNENSHQHESIEPVLKYEIGSNDWSQLEAYKPDPMTMEAYEFAVSHPEVLDYMPCYCGCYEEDGHVSNTHCFVDRVEDNVAILDNMGLS